MKCRSIGADISDDHTGLMVNTTRADRTAIRRTSLSRPVALALDDGLIHRDRTFFDYGCGRGDDLLRLHKMGIPVSGWDPAFFPDEQRMPADVVNLGYVVNVIEDPEERVVVLAAAWGLARKVLIVSARLDWEATDAAIDFQGDGIWRATSALPSERRISHCTTSTSSSVGRMRWRCCTAGACVRQVLPATCSTTTCWPSCSASAWSGSPRKTAARRWCFAAGSGTIPCTPTGEGDPDQPDSSGRRSRGSKRWRRLAGTGHSPKIVSTGKSSPATLAAATSSPRRRTRRVAYPSGPGSVWMVTAAASTSTSHVSGMPARP